MYSTCIFCHAPLGANDAIEHFPVGARLAFDADRGRLWVICGGCARWNLSPLDERWEAIEDAERVFRRTRLRVTTDNIGLARLPDGTQLVRIGAPLRPEFAAWRYGTRFATRRFNTAIVVGSAAAAAVLTAIAVGPLLMPALTAGAISIVAVPGITSAMGVPPMVAALATRDYLLHDRVIARFKRGRRVLTVRARHVRDAEFHMAGDHPTLRLPHDGGWAYCHGAEALHMARVLLVGANRFGASTARVHDAVARIERAGDASSYLRTASRVVEWREGRVMSVLNGMRQLGVLHLSTTESLALEMAMHEESERRALEGELLLLADAWRDAEEIASIADGLLPPAGFEQLRALRPSES